MVDLNIVLNNVKHELNRLKDDRESFMLAIKEIETKLELNRDHINKLVGKQELVEELLSFVIKAKEAEDKMNAELQAKAQVPVPANSSTVVE